MNGPPPPSRRNRAPATNSPSSLLSDMENETIFGMLGKKCFTLATCVVQVYLAEGSGRDWQKRCTGVVCFVKDNPMRSYYIRVYSLRNHSKVWEQELYNQFKYSTPRSYFHTFDTDKCRAGLNFASEAEAYKFQNIVEEKIKQKQERRTAKVRSSSVRTPTSPRPGPGQNHVPNSAPNYNTASRPVVNHTVIDNKQQPKAVIENKKDKKKGKNKKKKLSKTDIGSPSGFQHVGHVGWDPNKGFDMNNMDPDVKDLFASAGITEKDMEDKEKAQFIYDFIEKQGGIEAVKKDRSTRAPPPPPPSRGARGSLPPPPPSRSNNVPPPAQNRRPDNNRREGPPPPPQRHSGAVPPPPPQSTHKPRVQQQQQPPPSGNIPPPPMMSSIPPPPMMSGGRGGGAVPPPPNKPAAGGGRGALLSQIHLGTKLKSSGERASNPPPANKGGGGGRGALLDAIRKGAALNKVSQESAEKSPPPQEEDVGLAGALARALHNRAKDIHTDSESSDAEDSEDEWSD